MLDVWARGLQTKGCGTMSGTLPALHGFLFTLAIISCSNAKIPYLYYASGSKLCFNPFPPFLSSTGTIGHVAHGKSTVVKAISGVQTVRFKNELERNITIKLGYANAKIYACSDPKCPRPATYRAFGSGKEDAPPCEVPGFEGVPMQLLRHVSFVDCPGHDILMATMLNGAAVMDGALLLIAANEPCPQPQTSEHLAAVEIMRLRHIIILQNKVDLVTESAALNQAESIARFVQGTIAEPAPVIPVSAQLKYNIDAVCEYIVKKIPVPVRDFVSPPQVCCVVMRGRERRILGGCLRVRALPTQSTHPAPCTLTHLDNTPDDCHPLV